MSNSLWPYGLQSVRLLWPGILQVRTLECVATPSSRGSSRQGSKPATLRPPALAGGFTTIATWEVPLSHIPLLKDCFFVLNCLTLAHMYFIWYVSISLWPLKRLSHICECLRVFCGGESAVACWGDGALAAESWGSTGRHKSSWRLPLALCKSLQTPAKGLHRERPQPYPAAENRTKYLLSMALPTRASPSFPHSQSLASESLHKPVILIH